MKIKNFYWSLLGVLLWSGTSLQAQEPKWEFELTPQVSLLHQYPVGDFYNLRDVQLPYNSVRARSYEALRLAKSISLAGSYALHPMLRVGMSLKHTRAGLHDLAGTTFDDKDGNGKRITYSTRFLNWQAGVFAQFQVWNTDVERWYFRAGYSLNHISWPQIFKIEDDCGACPEYSGYQENERRDWNSGFLAETGWKWRFENNFIIGFGLSYEYLLFNPSTVEVTELQVNGQSQLNEFPAAEKNFVMTDDPAKAGTSDEGATYLQREEYRFSLYSVFLNLGYSF